MENPPAESVSGRSRLFSLFEKPPELLFCLFPGRELRHDFAIHTDVVFSPQYVDYHLVAISIDHVLVAAGERVNVFCAGVCFRDAFGRFDTIAVRMGSVMYHGFVVIFRR